MLFGRHSSIDAVCRGFSTGGRLICSSQRVHRASVVVAISFEPTNQQWLFRLGKNKFGTRRHLALVELTRRHEHVTAYRWLITALVARCPLLSEHSRRAGG